LTTRHDEATDQHEAWSLRSRGLRKLDHGWVTIAAVVLDDEIAQSGTGPRGERACRNDRLEPAASATDWVLDVQILKHAQTLSESIE
jgi:hypothetical protein